MTPAARMAADTAATSSTVSLGRRAGTVCVWVIEGLGFDVGAREIPAGAAYIVFILGIVIGVGEGRATTVQTAG